MVADGRARRALYAELGPPFVHLTGQLRLDWRRITFAMISAARSFPVSPRKPAICRTTA